MDDTEDDEGGEEGEIEPYGDGNEDCVDEAGGGNWGGEGGGGALRNVSF